MSLRIRTTGEILCAAMHPPAPGDVYVDDAIHYLLTVERKLIVTEPMHVDGGRGGHAKHGEWWWRNEVPPDVMVAPFYIERWPGEHCKRCQRRNCVGFDVPDTVWNAVVRDRWNVLCTTCFDEEAEAAGVPYSLGEVWPVSWSNWSNGCEQFGGEARTSSPPNSKQARPT